MQKAVSGATYGASFTSFVSGALSLNEWAILLGIIFAGLTFLANYWFQHKRNQREARKHEDDREFHRARMEALQQSDQAQLLCQESLNAD
ncbi:phage holin [Pseudoalteromonas sp. T1lg22]|uniref:phage holin n=1 Tax=Pseudoalteromonas sp. T1lg22 TaxID=2077096 RepID=UPI001319FEF3|nr:phage holin [Pseudoalteromonas sp. T1lg22]